MHDASMALTSHPQPKDASSLAELARQRGLTEKEMKRLTKTHSASAVLPSGALIQEPLGAAGSWELGAEEPRCLFFSATTFVWESHTGSTFWLLGCIPPGCIFFWGGGI